MHWGKARHLLPVAGAVDIIGVLLAASPGAEVLVGGLVPGGEVGVQPAEAAHKAAGHLTYLSQVLSLSGLQDMSLAEMAKTL